MHHSHSYAMVCSVDSVSCVHACRILSGLVSVIAKSRKGIKRRPKKQEKTGIRRSVWLSANPRCLNEMFEVRLHAACPVIPDVTCCFLSPTHDACHTSNNAHACIRCACKYVNMTLSPFDI